MALTPLQTYASYDASKGIDSLNKEKEARLGKLKQQFAAQSNSLQGLQRQQREGLDQNLNRFAAMNNLSTGSGSLLKFRETQGLKQQQEFAGQNENLGAQQAAAEEALSSEIGQREGQERQMAEQSRQFGGQLNLAMDESAFNKGVAQYQAALASFQAGLNSPKEWDAVIGDPNGPFAQLFANSGIKLQPSAAMPTASKPPAASPLVKPSYGGLGVPSGY